MAWGPRCWAARGPGEPAPRRTGKFLGSRQ